MAKQTAINANATFELEQTDENRLVYRPNDAEKGEKSMMKPSTLTLTSVPLTKEQEAAQLDALVAEIEGVGSNENTKTNPKKKSKGKGKK